MAKYDIFISYRRDGGYDTSKHLYDLLTRDGYKVSFDIDTLRNGDFDTSLLKRIDECKDFILVIDAHAFDRTLDSNFNPQKDWLRQELSYALKKNKNIIPIFLNGVKGFPDNLPEDIRQVETKNGPEYNRYYFNDFYGALKQRFLTSRSRRPSVIAIAIIIALILLISGVVFIYSLTSGNTNKAHDDIYNKAETNAIIPDTKIKEQDPHTKLKRFCGSFSYVIPNQGYGGINYVYDLVLDPLNSKASIVEEGIVNITDSKGYYGTMMQWPEYWEVTNFSLNENGKEAIVQMIGGDNNVCEIKLKLDDYNNIVMSFISGNEGPGVLIDENGDYKNTVVFKRDN